MMTTGMGRRTSVSSRPPTLGSQRGHYDDDRDGTADVSLFEAFNANPERATDPEGSRHQALGRVVDTWNSVREAAGESRGVEFGLWTFDGEATGASHPWASENQQVQSALETARSSEVSGRGNVLESIASLLNDQGPTPFAGNQYQGLDKTLVVLTDGPPELASGRNANATIDAVIEAANEAGVRLFVVHLDPAVAMGEPRQVLDDPAYYLEQSNNC